MPDLNRNSHDGIPRTPKPDAALQHLRPGLRAQSIILELVRPARIGPFFTVKEVVEQSHEMGSGLCRVTPDGEPGWNFLVTVDPDFADPERAKRLVRYINDSAVANILNTFGERPHD